MSGNDFMAWLLRSPFHGVVSNSMLLLTVTGRKTGREITFPVGYYQIGDVLWVITNRDRTWWRNLASGAGVGLVLRRKSLRGEASLVLDEAAVCERLPEYLHHELRALKPFGIRMVNSTPNADDVARAAQSRLFVRIHLS